MTQQHPYLWVGLSRYVEEPARSTTNLPWYVQNWPHTLGNRQPCATNFVHRVLLLVPEIGAPVALYRIPARWPDWTTQLPHPSGAGAVGVGRAGQSRNGFSFREAMTYQEVAPMCWTWK
jgi:hypothetical protein